MANMGVIRARSYLLLQGLERSIAENLTHNFDVDVKDFLVPSETDRALERLRDDMQDSAWSLQDVSSVDLLRYLDLGDLLGLLNRHKSDVLNAKPSDIQASFEIIQHHGIHAIRKRVMHPVRPLEAGDYNALLSVARDLPLEAPSLIWEPLTESLSLIENPKSIADASIPPFWQDELRTVNNLPVAEFEDTGFIGRGEERRRLKNLILSDHKVVTVVGAGGIGKTALAMRVCHDLIDDSSNRFDNVIWVSLKTQFLTTDGIRTIADAVDSRSRLLDELTGSVGITVETDPNISWEPIIEHLARHNTLLIIDNLETLGTELRDLAMGIPQGSKLLMTSRIGLGELEIRYDMPDFSDKDSETLMRVLGSAYGYQAIRQLSERQLRRFCRRLHHNPLLIKWFVQAVGKGSSPDEVLAHEEFEGALNFCIANVYSGLTSTAKSIVSTLLAGRRSLSQAQIRELVGVDRVTFDSALLELRQSNVIETLHQEDNSTLYQISGLVLDYLARSHPPSDCIVRQTRENLRRWQVEQDRSASAQNAYRYSKSYVLVETIDHRIAAPSLRDALRYVSLGNIEAAEQSLARALELTPDWSEVHRVRAHVLRSQQRPIYEVENAFEDSLRYGASDINRRDYAVFLMGIEEHERAYEQVEAAISLGTGVETVLRSLKALALTRLGRLAESIDEHEFVWSSKELNQSQYDRKLQGTQYAESLRRFVEQLKVQGKEEDATKALITGIQVVEETAADCGWDDKLVTVAIRLLAEKIDDSTVFLEPGRSLSKIAQDWDSLDEFVGGCNLARAVEQFTLHVHLADVMPRCARRALGADYSSRFEGRVASLMGSYGFIECNELNSVHMRATSLKSPAEWTLLRVGQRVQFSVINQVRGLHAIRLELL